MTARWKKDALAQLGQYDALCLAADNLESALGDCRVTGPADSDRRLDALAERKALATRAESCRRQVERMDRALQALNPAQRLVLELLCIRPERGNLERLCSMLGCEKSTVYRRRDKGLRLFAMALFGR